jgi:hypothetical protein
LLFDLLYLLILEGFSDGWEAGAVVAPTGFWIWVAATTVWRPDL